MTQQEALRLAQTRFWEEMDFRQRAMFQLFEPRLCMPFEVFHEAVEHALGRPVWTHEFGLNWEGLQRELLGDRPAPSLDEILDLLPPDRRFIVISGR
jgi:hypothetical protein